MLLILFASSESSGAITKHSTAITTSTNAGVNTNFDTSSVTSATTASVTKGSTTSMAGTTKPIVSAESTIIASYRSGTVTKENTVTSTTTKTGLNTNSDTGTIMDPNTHTSTSISDRNGHATVQCSFATVATNSNERNSAGAGYGIKASSSKATTSNVWPITSSIIHYGNSKSQLPSSHMASEEVPFTSVPSTNKPYSSSTVTTTLLFSLSTYEGVGALNKSLSLTSFPAIVVSMFI